MSIKVIQWGVGAMGSGMNKNDVKTKKILKL